MNKEFASDKPIYRQIVDSCLNMVSSGQWQPGHRIPSVKELSVNITVNPRTVMHAYEELTNLGIIFQKRGMGFYLSENAVTIVADLRRNDFEMVTLPDFIEKLRASGYPVREAIARIAESLDGTDR